MRASHFLLFFGLFCGCAVLDGLQGTDGERSDDTTPDGGTTGNPGGNGDGGTEPDPSDPGSNAATWKWHGPVLLDGNVPVQSDAPRLAVRPGGRYYAAWHEYKLDTNTSSVWITTRAPGATSWEAPRSLPEVAGNPIAMYPQVAVGGTSPAMVVYGANDGAAQPVRSIRAARFKDDLTVAPGDIARVDATGSRTPQLSQVRSLAMDENGRAIVVWGEDDGIHANASATLDFWNDPKLVDGNNAFSWATIDVAASRGTALLSWSRSDGVLARIASIFTGSYESAGQVHALGTGSSLWASVAARNGHGHVLWKTGGALQSEVYDATKWTGAPGVLGAQRVGFAARLAQNRAGRAVATWQQTPQGASDYRESNVYAALFDGSSWSTPELISAAGVHRKAWWIAVDMNEHGDMLAAWADFDAGGKYTRIWASLRRAEAVGWGPATAIDVDSPGAGLADQPENVRYVNVALDPTGSGGTVVWMQHEPGGNPRAWANWLE